MKKIPYLIIAVLLLSTVSWFVFGGKSTLAPADETNTLQDSASNAKRISIANMAFSPQTVTVATGTTVRWVNNDSVEHAIATEDGSDSPNNFDSAGIAVGAAYTLQLNKPGTYKYYCKLHPNMKGEIIVK